MSDDVDPKGLIKEDVDAPDAGKYLLIEVPNFNKAPDQDAALQMGSYIRLGAAAADAGVTTQARRTGEDLAGMVQGFVDDTRDRDGIKLDPLGVGVSGKPVNLPPEETLDPASKARSAGGNPRREESRVLHTKGGWRDHSDGNRITTTRGDKVEVIRGNYKMVVLGRQDEIGEAAGWDVSGGIVDPGDLDFASTPDTIANPDDRESTRSQKQEERKNARPRQQNLSIEHKWDQDSDGRWGWTQTTITGNELIDARPVGGAMGAVGGTEPPKHGVGSGDANRLKQGGIRPWGGDPRGDQLAPSDKPSQGDPGNGKIITKTWVDMIETHTGSSAKRVDRMSDETWANSITSTTNVGQMTQSIYCTGNFTQLTDAGAIAQTFVSSGQLTAAASAHHITTTNHASMIQYEDWATLRTEIDVAIALMAEIKLAPVIAELRGGVHLDVHGGGHIDITGVELAEIVIGHHTQVNLVKEEAALEEHEIKALKTALEGGVLKVADPSGSTQMAPIFRFF